MEKTTREQYAEAVARLVELARQPTSGGRVAAQVLLSAYNGFDFQLGVANMGSLDRKNFETAMTIIRGRYETGHEPRAHQALPPLRRQRTSLRMPSSSAP